MNNLYITAVFLGAVMAVIGLISLLARLFSDYGDDVILNPVVIMFPGEDAERKLRCLKRQVRLGAAGQTGKILIVCPEEETELSRLCSSFCEKNREFEFCPEPQLKNILSELQKNKGK
jgi:hypothetical protein